MASENETAETEVLIIGSGPGGYVAAIRAAQHGLETTLVEKDRIGGVCLNRGCIPSKALVTASDIADEASTAEAMGIHADPAVDMADTTGWKDTVVDRLTGGVEKLCTENGVTLVDGTASFVDEQTVRITESDDPDAVDTIDFEYAIIATGSRPIEVPGLEFVSALDLRSQLRDTPRPPTRTSSTSRFRSDRSARTDDRRSNSDLEFRPVRSFVSNAIAKTGPFG